MNKVEKKALKKLTQKVKNLKSKQEDLLLKLLENQEYKSYVKKENELIIQISKEEFENKTSNNKEKLEKIINQKNLLAKTLSDECDILEKQYLCADCKDTGYRNAKPCKCLKAEISQMLLDESGINQSLPKFKESNFDLFENKKQMQTIYAKLEEWAKSYKKSKVKNWGLFGSTGTGKTHLMLTVANQLIKDGNYVYFTTAFNMTKEMLNQHTDFEDKQRDYISKYLDCDVLFIDDLGTEPLYNNVNQNYLYLITNQRMLENKPTIFSTNFDLGEFEDRYGERIFSRLINKRNSVSIWFDGNDIRLKK